MSGTALFLVVIVLPAFLTALGISLWGDLRRRRWERVQRERAAFLERASDQQLGEGHH